MSRPISVAMLHRLLICDADAGKLYWRERLPDMFHETNGRTADFSCAIWNGKFAGKEAFTAPSTRGYLCGRIFGKAYKAHRIIWAMATGILPQDAIDHINGLTSDNRLSNLRCVGQSDNLKNAAIHSHNTSGVMGVSWLAHSGKWRAYIKIDGRQNHLGHFAEFDHAVAARKLAEQTHGFHQNHGRVAQ